MARDQPVGPIPVLFLVTNFNRGGAEKILSRLAAGLQRDKYAPQVAALQGRSLVIAGDLRRTGVPAHDLEMRWKGDIRILGRLARLLQQERIQILVTFLFHPTLLGRLVGWFTGVPIRISSERTMAFNGHGRRLLNRWTVPLASHVVAVSERVAAHATRQFRIPQDRLSVIPNGVNLQHFHPANRVQSALGPVIGCTARLHPENDHATLLQAFAQVSNHRSDARLLLLGSGRAEAQLRALAERLGISASVCFEGEQGDVAPWLARMDLYVQPSIAAGMSNSVLEAMAAGLPVVATAVGGTPDLVLDEQTGLLVKPGDPVALGDALLTLLA
ncbi:MAG TPA: glycosyltransferase, partial [Candidatus Acidoferrum sp.]|nr:glycosyltransferase [Candidatus Acidoferrum sp.]